MSDPIALLEADERGAERNGLDRCKIRTRVPDYSTDFDDAPRERAQGALIDFIYADLDLAFTLLRTAEIEARDDPKGCEMALTKARSALKVIRRLGGRVDSSLMRREIMTGADQLERALRPFRS